MLGLYLDTRIIGYKYCSMLSILFKLTLQKECQTIVTNNLFWTKNKTTSSTKQNIKHKNPCQSQESNTEPLAPQSDAWALDDRDNWTYPF